MEFEGIDAQTNRPTTINLHVQRSWSCCQEEYKQCEIEWVGRRVNITFIVLDGKPIALKKLHTVYDHTPDSTNKGGTMLYK